MAFLGLMSRAVLDEADKWGYPEELE